MKKKTLSASLVFVAFLQIILLGSFSVSASYTLSFSQESIFSATLSRSQDIDSFFEKGFSFLVSFFSISQIGIVSAADACCEKTLDGGLCVDTDDAQCDTDFSISGTSCALTSYCTQGWCFDPRQGICSEGAPKAECERKGGTWAAQFNELANQCQPGCCYLGSNTQYVERARCEILSRYLGVATDFDEEISEKECRFLSEDEGACVQEGGSCTYTSEKTCYETLDGDFYRETHCSTPSLNTSCDARARTGCVDGKNDVYYFDSCGNPEGVADACAQEETCKFDRGQYRCADTSCVDAQENTHINGESWCSFDAYVGEGKDIPGSSHWLQYCDDGEVITELCGEGYREQICGEKIVDGRSVAQCRTNFAAACFGFTTQAACETFPTENSSECYWHTVDLRSHFTIGGLSLPTNDKDTFYFSACLPRYPKGFDLSSPNPNENGQNVCSALGDNGKVTCTRVEKKGLGGWECIANCRCTSQDFVEQMNDFCSALGDCGASVNLAGDVSGGIPLSGKYDRSTTAEWARRYSSLLTLPNVVGVNTPAFMNLNRDAGSYGSILVPENPEIGGNVIPYLLASWGGGIVGVAALGPLGLVAIGIGIITTFVFGLGKTRERATTFTCLPWQPVVGGENCDICNQNPDKPCTAYQCASLGSTCQLEENIYGSEHPLCYDASPDDVTPPSVSVTEVDPGRFSVSNNVVMIQEGGGNSCYTRYATPTITITTNELAQCRWSSEFPVNFDDAEGYFTEGVSWATTHVLDSWGILGGAQTSIYVRCQDKNGNWLTQPLEITTCISEEPDLVAAQIKRFNPAQNSYLPFYAMNVTFTAYLNEPADCRYSETPNTLFENMVENMICNNDDETSYDYRCSAFLDTFQGESITTYLRCNDTSGNVHTQDIVYTLQRTPTPLEVILVSPRDGETIERIIDASDPFILEAQTSGGAQNGVAVCNFVFSEHNWRDYFTKTNSTRHTYSFTNLPEGNHTLSVQCSDAVGNSATNTIGFSRERDEEAPQIIRAFHEGSFLTFRTDEPAQCVYTTDATQGCTIDFANATLIDARFTLDHRVNWNADATYYLKCKDEYNNPTIGCALVVRPSALI